MSTPEKSRVVRVFCRAYEIVTTVIILFAALTALLFICGIRLYNVRSGSMGDLIPQGSICFVSTYTGFDSIERGDVIAFRLEDDMLVTHRAIGITDEGIYTFGDENDIRDPDPVTKDNYIGKTVFAIPKLGKLLAFTRSVKGIIFIAVTILLLTAAGIAYKRMNK